MANMSYCRFENTASDLRDCLNELAEAVDEGMSLKQFTDSLSSDYERSALRQMIRMCADFTEAVEQLESYEEGVLVDDDA